MDTFTYFAYGSNMLSERLLVRCSSAQTIGVAFAAGCSLEFSKKSKDASGKATLNKVDDPGQKTYGVLFEIETGELADLDKAEGEGFGYDRVDTFFVTLVAGHKPVYAKTYIASGSYIDTELVPYDWYQALVIQGAVQNKLPEEHISSLRDFTATVDPDPNRPLRKQALEVLARAGVHDIAQIL